MHSVESYNHSNTQTHCMRGCESRSLYNSLFILVCQFVMTIQNAKTDDENENDRLWLRIESA